MHLLLAGGCGVVMLAVILSSIWLGILAIKRAPAPPPAAKDRPVEERLAHLARLREQDLISEDELRQKRQQLLDEI
jgi:hypothetical protein